MSEILINIISVVVTAVVLPIITLIGGKLVSFISSKINNEKTSNVITKATEIVINSVKAVLQTYVDTLKKNGSFDEASQKLALLKAKDMALSQMTDDVKEYIEKNYGSLDSWLSTTIEAAINTLKNK